MNQASHNFIWEYQRTFHSQHEARASQLFQKLDKRFQPQVFLVGVPIETSPNHLPVCVGFEESFWLASDAFIGVADLADHLLKTEPPGIQLVHSDSRAHQHHKEALSKRTMRNAILRVINECPAKPQNMEYSASVPVKKEQYLVSILIGLQLEVIESHYRLSSKTIERFGLTRNLPKSLIQTAVGAFLQDAVANLEKPDAGAFFGPEREEDELIRAAGKFFMITLAHRVDPQDDHVWRNQFHAFSTIASLRYESGASDGVIVLAHYDHPAFTREVTFSEPLGLWKYRGSRKLLELSSKDLSLQSNAEGIIGLGRVCNYKPDSEDLFEIRFIGHHDWEVRHDTKPLMRVRYGEPSLPQPTFLTEELRETVSRVLPSTTKTEREKLVSLVEQAAKAKKGTILIISEDAPSEAQRLRGESTPVEPFLLAPGVLESLAAIDGAVLMHPDGKCYSIGVILDGMATEHGDRSRGSRYNSAVRYVESRHGNCLAIIVSEDGDVNFFPDQD